MSDSDSQRRLRTYTEKGLGMYESTRDKLLSKLQETWKLVEFSVKIELLSSNKESVSNKLTDIEKHYKALCALSDEYVSFLRRQNTEQSSRDLSEYSYVHESRKNMVHEMVTSLQEMLQKPEEAASVHSTSSRRTRKSHSSVSSSMSSILAKTRAKAEAARVTVQFAEKEAALRKESARLEQERIQTSASVELRKAELEADLNLLSQQKDAAAAEAEYKALHY